MKFNPSYTTAKSKWYLCFCCLWSRCCVPPDAALEDEYTFLHESTSDFFHQTDWEKLYPMCRGLQLTKDAEQEAKVIYAAYIQEAMPDLIASNSIPNIEQILRFWRWLNSDKKFSLLHDNF
jgi:hypothetical protein